MAPPDDVVVGSGVVPPDDVVVGSVPVDIVVVVPGSSPPDSGIFNEPLAGLLPAPEMLTDADTEVIPGPQ